MCPSVNADGTQVISVPGIKGAKGQAGLPGIGEPGKRVSNKKAR